MKLRKRASTPVALCIAALLALACSEDHSSDITVLPNNSGTSEVGMGIPALLNSRRINPDDLSVEVTIGGVPVLMSREGDQWRGMFSLPPGSGSYTLLVTWFRFIDGERLNLAISQPMELNADSDRNISLASYSSSQFDEDKDLVSNLDELDAGTDPTVANVADDPGTTTDGSTTGGSTTDGTTTDGSTTDGSTTDGSTTDGSTTDGSTTDGTTTDGSTTDGGTTDGGTTGGSITDGSTTDGSTTGGSTTDGSTTDGSTTDGSTTDGGTTDGGTTVPMPGEDQSDCREAKDRWPLSNFGRGVELFGRIFVYNVRSLTVDGDHFQFFYGDKAGTLTIEYLSDEPALKEASIYQGLDTGQTHVIFTSDSRTLQLATEPGIYCYVLGLGEDAEQPSGDDVRLRVSFEED